MTVEGKRIGRKAVQPNELSQHMRPDAAPEPEPVSTKAQCECSHEPPFPH